ncbi:MAG TPA: hypothetical protein PLY34_15745 [Ferruginibacter sp.]|nr:hypothetical protein [Ferruginibacter sp.]HPH92617.1 hypothetical protein [Ferruginibacter sp.]
MTKEAMQTRQAHVHLSVQALQDLQNKGYQFVQVKGLNEDNEFDYVEPHYLVLVPIKELPKDQRKKDIYEPVMSELLIQMANEESSITEVLISEVA